MIGTTDSLSFSIFISEKEIDDTKTIRKHEDETYKKPGDEVASWIRNKDIGYTKRDPNTGAVLPIHHKHTSDVTQQVRYI